MHQYHKGEVKLQELRNFLQINTVRSSDIDKMHFSHCWLRLCQMQANISSLNLEQTFYRLTYSPTPLYIKFTREPFLQNCATQTTLFGLNVDKGSYVPSSCIVYKIRVPSLPLLKNMHWTLDETGPSVHSAAGWYMPKLEPVAYAASA